jgi:hypothetical protein
MSPAGKMPEYHDRHRRLRKLRPRTLTSEQTIKVLVAVGQLAALVGAVLRSCR